MVSYLVDQRRGINGPGIALSAERVARKDHSVAMAIEKLEKELRALPVEQLKKLYDAAKQKATAQNLVYADEKEAGRFFNKPAAQADFDHWSKMPYWNIDEAVALSLGKDPEKVKWKEVATLTEVSAFARNFDRRRDLARRAVGMRQLFDPTVPAIFLRWTRQIELSVPDELVHLVEQRAQTTTDWATALKNSQDEHAQTIVKLKKDQDGIFDWAKKQQDDLLEWGKEQHTKGLDAGKRMAEEILTDMSNKVSERDQTIAELNAKILDLQAINRQSPAVTNDVLNPKSRQSLLKLVLGLAVDGYGYDPKDKRSPIPKELADALSGRGISIDEDTVRKWLKEAGEVVDFSSPSQTDST
jgi:hypothetical protein